MRNIKYGADDDMIYVQSKLLISSLVANTLIFFLIIFLW